MILSEPATFKNAPEVIEALDTDIGVGLSVRRSGLGKTMMYVAVLIQREISVIGILRLGLPISDVRQSANQTMVILILTAIAVATGVSLFGWMLASNLARPIQVLTQAAGQMERGDLSVRVRPSGPEELIRLGGGVSTAWRTACNPT